jgi:hypothetical protein
MHILMSYDYQIHVNVCSQFSLMLYIHKLVFTETTELFANNNHNGNSTHIEMNRVNAVIIVY